MKTFSNPILPGFYPDPSICRLGEDYYLANSSFAYFPGVPLFHSRDLIHWRQIGHALTRKSQLSLDRVDKTFGFLDECRNSLGIWAPTLRYHDSTFYLVTTNMSHGGHFVVTARDPEGEWSDPIWLDQPGIDPSPFWDEDGRGYLLSNLWPGRPLGIVMSEMDFTTGKRLTEIRLIWEGMGAQSPEGPHLYKRGDFFYLIAAEGGTGPGHLVSLARSTSIWGPYESCPHNPILTHRSLSHPIQYTGHADLIEAHDGSWWMVFLGTRPKGHPATHHLGRETFLAPLEWTDDGWPVVNGGNPVQSVMLAPGFASEEPVDASLNRFTGFEWNFLRNPDPSRYEIREAELRLQGTDIPIDEGTRSPVWMGQRQTSFDAEVSVHLRFDPAGPDDHAGLCVYMNESHFYALSITKENGVAKARLHRIVGPLKDTTSVIVLPGDREIGMKITATAQGYAFFVKSGEWQTVGDAPCCYLSTEVAGGFTGVYFALHAVGDRAVATFSNWSHTLRLRESS